MNNNRKRELVYDIFQTLAPRYDSANVRISLGLEKGWKRLLTDRLLRELFPGEEGGSEGARAADLPEHSLLESLRAKRGPKEVRAADLPEHSLLESLRKKGGPKEVRAADLPECSSLSESLRKEGGSEGAHVLDICCGTGDAAIAIAGRRPDIRVTGLDFSPAMLAAAKKKGQGLPNLSWVQGDALRLPFPDASFDAVCISFGLRNTVDYDGVLRQMRRVLRPGGKAYCLDSFVPDNPIVRLPYRIYFGGIMPVLGGGWKYRRQYEWLSKSTGLFPPRREIMKRFARAGFCQVQSRSRMFGACVLIEGRAGVHQIKKCESDIRRIL